MSIGTSPPSITAPAMVTGETIYPADLHRVDTLHAKVVFSNRPHARMLDMDISAALETPGVVEVVTAADVPVNEYGLTLNDQPVLVGLGATDCSDIPSDISRWEADQIAVVVAETRQAADEGAKRLAVSWEDLPLAPDLDAALSGSTLVHPENGMDSNIYHQLRYRVGDMDEGWRAADVVVEGTYVLPHQEHAYLQPEAAMAYLDDKDRITVEIAGQWTHKDQSQIAHALDVNDEAIRVILPSDRGSVRWPGGHVVADSAGLGGTQTGPPGDTPAGADGLDTGGKHHRASQTAPGGDPCSVGRHPRGAVDGG